MDLIKRLWVNFSTSRGSVTYQSVRFNSFELLWDKKGLKTSPVAMNPKVYKPQIQHKKYSKSTYLKERLVLCRTVSTLKQSNQSESARTSLKSPLLWILTVLYLKLCPFLVTMQQPNHTKVIVFTEVSKFMCTIFIGIPSFRFIC